MESIYLLAVKAKSYLIATAIAFLSSSVRYVEYKRKWRNGEITKKKIKIANLTDWFLFGVMASIVTWTFLACIESLGYEVNMIVWMTMFWMGYLTDYLYQWIPILIKKQLGKIMKQDTL